MICAACCAEIPDGDQFCENCGEKLPEAPEDTISENALPGCSCGAAADHVDEDGYCLQCGKRLRRPAADHIEESLSRNFAAVSDRGLRHEQNEDRFALVQGIRGFAMVVCDGVSSTQHSEVASATVCAALERVLREELGREGELVPEDALKRGLQAARSDLLALQGVGDGEAPSTTVVAAMVVDNEITVAWAGDSRAYWIAEEAAQLTKDHSWWQEAVDTGALTKDEANASPQAHAITRWLGADADPQVAEEFVRHRVESEGLLLLCSDGLWNYTPEPAALAAVVTETGAEREDTLAIAKGLVMFANEQGGRDNVTAAVLRLWPASSETGETRKL